MLNLQIVLSLVLLTTHYALSETYEQIKAACESEHKINDLRAININDPAVPVEAKCALACMLEKMKVFQEDGSINKSEEKKIVEETVKEEDTKKMILMTIDECDGSAKATKCDTAFEYVKCKNNKLGTK